MLRAILLLFMVIHFVPRGVAQVDALVLVDETYDLGDPGVEPGPDLVAYEKLVIALGADSLRQCDGFPCSAWVEDRYPDGALKHRGYYDAGRIITYKNHYADGTLEREFKVQGTSKSTLRTYHSNGQIRSETRYEGSQAVAYEDHYVNGTLRYAEERHRKRPYYTRMDLYDGNGRPISLLRLVDARHEEFEQREFHPGGALKCEGRARYHPSRMDTQRVGTWKWYEADGTLLREEQYIDGMVHR